MLNIFIGIPGGIDKFSRQLGQYRSAEDPLAKKTFWKRYMQPHIRDWRPSALIVVLSMQMLCPVVALLLGQAYCILTGTDWLISAFAVDLYVSAVF